MDTAKEAGHTTVLIGGAHDGRPIICVARPMETLVMPVGEDGEREGYTLRELRNKEGSRLFYTLDGMPVDEAEKLMQERWAQGLIRSDS